MRKIHTYLEHQELCNLLEIGIEIPIGSIDVSWDNLRKMWVIETELDVAEQQTVKEK
jgi:hypothetical protein